MRATEQGARRHDVLVIEGMFCAACAASVEATLRKQPGVDDASVNFAADAAVLDWSGEAANDVLAAVEGLGYRVRFAGDGYDLAKDPNDPARSLYLKLIIALFFGMWAMLPSVALYLDAVDTESAPLLAWAAGLLTLPVVLYSGLPFYRMGLATLRAGVAGIDALVLLGVLGSLILSGLNLARGSAEVYFEVPIALITLQLIARLLDLRVRRRARDAVLGLLELAPSELIKLEASGRQSVVLLSEIKAGDCILVRPGSRIAIDGMVTDGRAELDRSLLSGEAQPVAIGKGDVVNAGERVLDGALTIEVSAAAGKRRIDGLARQVRQVLAKKPAWQRVAELVARYFLWGSAVAALISLIAVYATGGSAEAAAVRALAVFVIACPCALSLAAPLAGLSASAAAARMGMIIRDLNAATSAARPDCLFVDKTGTLTLGRPVVRAVHPLGDRNESDVIRAAALAENASEHPIALAICAIAGEAVDGRGGSTYAESGHGVEWVRGEEKIRVGKPSWFGDEATPRLPETAATRVFVERNGRLIGAIDLEDALRDGITDAIGRLREMGVKTVILSGDSEAAVASVADEIGVPYIAGLAPEEKLARVEAAQSAGDVVAFAGDGINDGPALAAAELGIAVAGSTDAARTAAAVSFVDAGVVDIPRLLRLTRRTRRIIRQNLVWAIAYNTVAIPAAMIGWVHPAIAAAAMALSSITIVLNASRARDFKSQVIDNGGRRSATLRVSSGKAA